MNRFDFTLDVQDTAQKKYREILQAAQKDPKKLLELEKADTGKVYLRKGGYIFVMEKDEKKVEREFTIE